MPLPPIPIPEVILYAQDDPSPGAVMLDNRNKIDWRGETLTEIVVVKRR